jgi:hypothetical protein
MEYPTTRKEAKRTGAKYYFTGISCKHGHVALRKTKGACVECIKLEWQAGIIKRKEYFKSAPAVLAAKKRYYAKNKELVIARANATDPEDRKRYRKKWKDNNKDWCQINTSQYRRRHRMATPAWLTPEEKIQIKRIYAMALEMTRMTGIRYSVDHEIPLRSLQVCGLHAPWNLKILPHEANSSKGNRF